MDVHLTGTVPLAVRVVTPEITGVVTMAAERERTICSWNLGTTLAEAVRSTVIC